VGKFDSTESAEDYDNSSNSVIEVSDAESNTESEDDDDAPFCEEVWVEKTIVARAEKSEKPQVARQVKSKQQGPLPPPLPDQRAQISEQAELLDLETLQKRLDKLSISGGGRTALKDSRELASPDSVLRQPSTKCEGMFLKRSLLLFCVLEFLSPVPKHQRRVCFLL
jgi:hypothetical protein